MLYRFGPDSFFGDGSQKAPSIGIQTTQSSNWYSKQVEQKIIYQQKQTDTDRFQITPAHQIPKNNSPKNVFFRLWNAQFKNRIYPLPCRTFPKDTRSAYFPLHTQNTVSSLDVSLPFNDRV